MKYLTVGHPPAPGLRLPPLGPVVTRLAARLTSPNTTLSSLANCFTTSFHFGDCFTHQPQPSEAIQRTNIVLPESTAAVTSELKFDVVSWVEYLVEIVGTVGREGRRMRGHSDA